MTRRGGQREGRDAEVKKRWKARTMEEERQREHRKKERKEGGLGRL